MNMEFISRNLVNTTSMLTTNGATGTTVTLAYLFDRKDNTQFTFGTDTGSLYAVLGSVPVSRIAIQGYNMTEWDIEYYHPSGTAAAILILNSDTNTSSWSADGSITRYLYFATITVNTLLVRINNAATTTCVIQQLWIGDKYHTLEYNPDYKDYNVKKNRKEFNHELSAGGYCQYVMDESYEASIKLEHVTASETAELRDIYDEKDAFTFVPFPTGTGWDGQIYECIWQGDYTFDNWAHNVKTSGYNGSIILRETGK